MPRGPKPKTPKNSLPRLAGAVDLTRIDPVSDLTSNALAEFRRLLVVLDQRGTLERIDLAVLTEAARIKDLLDRTQEFLAIGIDPKMVSTAGMLTSQRRGLLREMGLSIQPSRSVVKTTAKDATKATEPVAKLIKMAE